MFESIPKFTNNRRAADPASDETRARLLSAAGEVFAERGYRAATIRDICNKARANVAAVNYHFRDKEGLYASVLHDSYKAALEQYPPLLNTAKNAPAREQLEAFILSLLFRILDEGRPAWHGKLMMRELAEPSSALASFVEQGVRPLFELLQKIVSDLLKEFGGGRRPSKESVTRSACSVIGQCLFYKHARPVFDRLAPGQSYDRKSIEALANHIYQFSLAALRSEARRSK
ncbi:MAG: CerR family C-terminal domain-containing protein [Planctomycetota bacterium]